MYHGMRELSSKLVYVSVTCSFSRRNVLLLGYYAIPIQGGNLRIAALVPLCNSLLQGGISLS